MILGTSDAVSLASWLLTWVVMVSEHAPVPVRHHPGCSRVFWIQIWDSTPPGCPAWELNPPANRYFGRKLRSVINTRTEVPIRCSAAGSCERRAIPCDQNLWRPFTEYFPQGDSVFPYFVLVLLYYKTSTVMLSNITEYLTFIILLSVGASVSRECSSRGRFVF